MTATLSDRIKETDGEVTLADGRTLSYALLGDNEAERTVVVLDGPGSRGLARAAADAAAAKGVRLVAPDRPGFLGSTAKPGRTFDDVARDLLALADRLGAERFGVLAQSGGTPYALALAHVAPGRVSRLAFVGGITPLGEIGALKGVGGPMRGLFMCSRRMPFLLKPLVRMAAKNVEKNPEAAARKFAKAAPQADQDILAQPRYWDVHERTTAEAMGSPDQFAEEARLLARRWKVEPVAMPAAVWVGERDLTHPPVMARRLAERLGGVPVTVVPGAATFGMVPALRNVLDFVA